MERFAGFIGININGTFGEHSAVNFNARKKSSCVKLEDLRFLTIFKLALLKTRFKARVEDRSVEIFFLMEQHR